MFVGSWKNKFVVCGSNCWEKIMKYGMTKLLSVITPLPDSLRLLCLDFLDMVERRRALCVTMKIISGYIAKCSKDTQYCGFFEIFASSDKNVYNLYLYVG